MSYLGCKRCRHGHQVDQWNGKDGVCASCGGEVTIRDGGPFPWLGPLTPSLILRPREEVTSG